jgi:hypothetical protein
MVNNITFDELNILNSIEDTLKLAFREDSSQVAKYWFNLFGKKYMTIEKENYGVKTKFPIIVVTLLNPISHKPTNTQLEKNTIFDFEITQYNQMVGKTDKKTLGIMINNRIKYILQTEFGFNIITNQPIASGDDTIYRRILTGNAILNNATNTIYRV